MNFRYKTEEKCQNIKYEFENGKSEVFVNPMDDLYYCVFQSGSLLREACFECQYTGISRCADITLADFWGLKENAMVFPDEKTYPSLVFLNSEKGQMMFEENKGKWDVIEKIIGGKATAFLIKVLKR